MKNSKARTWKIRRDIALPRHEVWHLLSHTDHLNRAIGWAEVVFEPLPEDRDVLYREARTTANGLTLNYHDYPFNWQINRYYDVRRVFSSGPFREIVASINLEDSQAVPGGTLLEITATITPANIAGLFIAPKFAGDSLKKIGGYIESQLQRHQQAREQKAALQIKNLQPISQEMESAEIDYDLAFALPAPLLKPKTDEVALEVAQRRLLAQSRDELMERGHRTLDRDIINRLVAFIRQRSDGDVRSMRPFHLARIWECDPNQTLRVFLYATRAALLDLSWQLMCPNCRVSKVDSGQMNELEMDFHCDACGVMYRADFDRYIELRFRPHAAIRDVATGEYCIGGPFMTPHILVQQMVEPGESLALPVPAVDLVTNSPIGPLRLRTLRYNHSLELETQSEHAHTDDTRVLVYEDEGWTRRNSTIRGGQVNVQNSTQKAILVAIEKREWDDLAVTAAHVTTMNEFRELFGSQVLAPGQSVGVQNLTIFFSDLKDSTAMYESHGDAPAFGRVRSMFDYLSNHLETHDGAIVKTIGDAVMAVFRSPQHAVRAAIAMQHDLADFNQTLDDDKKDTHPLILKIGLHSGPSIVVNSNDRLDYFGRTVNLAARIQGASLGNDLVLSREVLDSPGVRDILSGASTLHPFQAHLKGIDDTIELYRVPLDNYDVKTPDQTTAFTTP